MVLSGRSYSPQAKRHHRHRFWGRVRCNVSSRTCLTGLSVLFHGYFTERPEPRRRPNPASLLKEALAKHPLWPEIKNLTFIDDFLGSDKKDKGCRSAMGIKRDMATPQERAYNGWLRAVKADTYPHFPGKFAWVKSCHHGYHHFASTSWSCKVHDGTIKRSHDDRKVCAVEISLRIALHSPDF